MSLTLPPSLWDELGESERIGLAEAVHSVARRGARLAARHLRTLGPRAGIERRPAPTGMFSRQGVTV